MDDLASNNNVPVLLREKVLSINQLWKQLTDVDDQSRLHGTSLIMINTLCGLLENRVRRNDKVGHLLQHLVVQMTPAIPQLPPVKDPALLTHDESALRDDTHEQMRCLLHHVVECFAELEYCPQSDPDFMSPRRYVRLILTLVCWSGSLFKAEEDCCSIVEDLLNLIGWHDDSGAEDVESISRSINFLLFTCAFEAAKQMTAPLFVRTPSWVALLNTAARFVFDFTKEELLSDSMPVEHRQGLEMLQLLADSTEFGPFFGEAAQLLLSDELWKAESVFAGAVHQNPELQEASYFDNEEFCHDLFSFDEATSTCVVLDTWASQRPRRAPHFLCGLLTFIAWGCSRPSRDPMCVRVRSPLSASRYLDALLLFMTIGLEKSVDNWSGTKVSWPVLGDAALKVAALRSYDRMAKSYQFVYLDSGLTIDQFPFSALALEEIFVLLENCENHHVSLVEATISAATFTARFWNAHRGDIGDVLPRITRVIERAGSCGVPRRSIAACWYLLYRWLDTVKPQTHTELATVRHLLELALLELECPDADHRPITAELRDPKANPRSTPNWKRVYCIGEAATQARMSDEEIFAYVTTQCACQCVELLWASGTCPIDIAQRFVNCLVADASALTAAFDAEPNDKDHSVTGGSYSDADLGPRAMVRASAFMSLCDVFDTLVSCVRCDKGAATHLNLQIFDCMIKCVENGSCPRSRFAFAPIISVFNAELSSLATCPDRLSAARRVALVGLRAVRAGMSPREALLCKWCAFILEHLSVVDPCFPFCDAMSAHIDADQLVRLPECSFFETAVCIARGAPPGAFPLSAAEVWWRGIAGRLSDDAVRLDYHQPMARTAALVLRTFKHEDRRSATAQYVALFSKWLDRPSDELSNGHRGESAISLSLMSGLCRYGDASLVGPLSTGLMDRVVWVLQRVPGASFNEPRFTVLSDALRLAQSLIDNSVGGRGASVPWSFIDAVLRAARRVLRLPRYAHPNFDPRATPSDSDNDDDDDDEENPIDVGWRPSVEARCAIAAVLASAEWLHQHCPATVTTEQWDREATLTRSVSAPLLVSDNARAESAAAAVVASVAHWLPQIEPGGQRLFMDDLDQDVPELWDRVARWAAHPSLGPVLLRDLPVPYDDLLRRVAAAGSASPETSAAVQEALDLQTAEFTSTLPKARRKRGRV